MFPFQINRVLREAQDGWGACDHENTAAWASQSPSAWAWVWSLPWYPSQCHCSWQWGWPLTQSQLDLPAYQELSSLMAIALYFQNTSLKGWEEITEIWAQETLSKSSSRIFSLSFLLQLIYFVERSVMSYWLLSGPLLFLLDLQMKSQLFWSKAQNVFVFPLQLLCQPRSADRALQPGVGSLYCVKPLSFTFILIPPTQIWAAWPGLGCKNTAYHQAGQRKVNV